MADLESSGKIIDFTQAAADRKERMVPPPQADTPQPSDTTIIDLSKARAALPFKKLARFFEDEQRAEPVRWLVTCDTVAIAGRTVAELQKYLRNFQIIPLTAARIRHITENVSLWRTLQELGLNNASDVLYASWILEQIQATPPAIRLPIITRLAKIKDQPSVAMRQAELAEIVEMCMDQKKPGLLLLGDLIDLADTAKDRGLSPHNAVTKLVTLVPDELRRHHPNTSMLIISGPLDPLQERFRNVGDEQLSYLSFEDQFAAFEMMALEHASKPRYVPLEPNQPA